MHSKFFRLFYCWKFITHQVLFLECQEIIQNEIPNFHCWRNKGKFLTNILLNFLASCFWNQQYISHLWSSPCSHMFPLYMLFEFWFAQMCALNSMEFMGIIMIPNAGFTGNAAEVLLPKACQLHVIPVFWPILRPHLSGAHYATYLLMMIMILYVLAMGDSSTVLG